MDDFERDLARLMRDTQQHAPFAPEHRRRLHEGIRARRRTRLLWRAGGGAVAAAGLGVVLAVLPGMLTRAQPPADHRPQPMTSPTPSVSAQPAPTPTPTAPEPSASTSTAVPTAPPPTSSSSAPPGGSGEPTATSEPSATPTESRTATARPTPPPSATPTTVPPSAEQSHEPSASAGEVTEQQSR
ncbi:cellulase [Streptomyces sp. NPDC052682]|uniref:cellulase n=1 Tax=Streptomyces sp. NPDC052682 TaxID=3154954 RepID=UPI00343FE494